MTKRVQATVGDRAEPEQPRAKVCDNASVGVLITDAEGRTLMFERTSPPLGIAPPAGHVFDEHGTRDQFDQAYIDAARKEVAEEVGLEVTALRMVVDRWADTPCGRACSPSGKLGHHWRVFQARVTGELVPSTRETRNARWYTPREMQELADRTVAWARRQISDEEFQARPGLEPVWVWWLGLLRVLNNDDSDLLAVLGLAEQPCTPPAEPASPAG